MNKLTNKVSNNMKSSLGKMGKYLSFAAITVGLTKLSKKVIKAASDLQEVQNVVDVAFGDASKEIDKFAKSAIHQFGLSEYAAKDMAATFMAIGKSMNIDESKAKTMSVQLTGLAADLASFYNTDVEEAYNALQAIYTGMIRPLRKFGVNLSETALQEYALRKGINKSVSSMNQAEKATLRYNYVLEATRLAQNDFIETHTSWHNALQSIGSQLNVLATTLGTILIKALTPVVNALAQVVDYAVKAAQALAALFGVELQFSSGRTGAGIADNWEDADEAINDATGSAKKYKKLIDGFDELNIMSSTGGGSGADDMDFGGGGFEVGKYFDITATEMEKVDFNTLVGKLDDVINKYRGKLEYLGELIGQKINGMFNYVDWTLLGKTIMDGLNTVFSSVNKYFDTTDFLNIGSKIGTMFNSSLQTLEPATWGQILINKFNAAFQTLYGFVTTLDWSLLRQRIGEIFANAFEKLDLATIKKAITITAKNIQKLIKDIDWYKIGHTVGEALAGVNWLSIFITVKNAIWEAIKGFWNGLMSDGKNLILGSVGKIGSFFKKSVVGIVIAAIGAGIAKIFTFVSRNIFTMGVITTKAAQLALGSTSAGIAEVVAGKGLTEQIGIVWRSIPDLIKKAGNKIGGVVKNIGFVIQTNGGGVLGVLKTIGFGIVDTFKDIVSGIGGLVSKLWGFLTANPAAMVIAGIALVVAAIKHVWDTSEAFRQHVKDIWENTLKPVVDRIVEEAKNLWDNCIKPLWDKLKDFFGAIWDLIKWAWDGIAQFIAWVAADILPPILAVVGEVIAAVMRVVANIGQAIGGVVDVLTNIIKFIKNVFTGNWQGVWENVKGIFKGIWDAFVGIVKAPINLILGFINALIGGVEAAINAIIRGLNKLSWDVPDWVPLLGGKHFGFNIKTVSWNRIAYLAKGGVLDQATMAMVGEYPGARTNPEIVTPTNLMREVFMESNEDLVDVMIQVGRQIVQAINDNETSITIGDDVISAAAARGAKNFKKMTGRNQFAI